jgi:hypothetical protein
MKPLPDEIEIQKVFDAIKSVSSLKVPDMSQVVFEQSGKSRIAYCSDVGEVGFNLHYCKDRTCMNFKFVETVCYEIVHYNSFELGHNPEFWTKLDKLFTDVIAYLNRKGVGEDVINREEEAQ